MNPENLLHALATWYETLTPASIGRVAEFYAADAHFIDPFNDVRGIAAIERIFRHMFTQVEGPRFKVLAHYTGSEGAMLVWQFSFHTAGQSVTLEGSSRLGFDAEGKICTHRDYWDPAASLFMRVPLLGSVLRWLYRRLRA
ncbi:MAG: hypothetical protein RJA63_1248 [Pseudomonadota bacterium]|jgi:hypothetical protein|nr:nuclear transport factor 2 family protein [Uliginosibacterium sp.]